jgi:uncharacterized protein YkwD
MHKFLACTLGLLLAALILPCATQPARAASPRAPQAAFGAYDLISAVNAVRTASGVAAYRSNSILMDTAQAQADFMAAIGTWSDYGPGGSTLGQRLLAAGYPLSGDLSLGGLASQNVIQGTTEMTPEQAVKAWEGDAPHRIALFSSALTEIGAGVTYKGNYVYYAIDCAQPTGSKAPLVYTPPAAGTAGSGSVGSIEATIPPAYVNTPDANGNVYHVVQAGQALWQIAIAYKVKINDIKSLNKLGSDVIYPGQKLLIMRAPTATPVSPTPKPTLDLSTAVPLPTLEVVTALPTGTSTPLAGAAPGPWSGPGAIGAIGLGALLAAGALAWLARTRAV